jgi:hypothetical protein
VNWITEQTLAMITPEEGIADAASKMSRKARAELAHRVIVELNADEQKAIDAAWISEIRRRVREIEEGEPLLDGDEVMRRARTPVSK